MSTDVIIKKDLKEDLLKELKRKEAIHFLYLLGLIITAVFQSIFIPIIPSLCLGSIFLIFYALEVYASMEQIRKRIKEVNKYGTNRGNKKIKL